MKKYIWNGLCFFFFKLTVAALNKCWSHKTHIAIIFINLVKYNFLPLDIIWFLKTQDRFIPTKIISNLRNNSTLLIKSAFMMIGMLIWWNYSVGNNLEELLSGIIVVNGWQGPGRDLRQQELRRSRRGSQAGRSSSGPKGIFSSKRTCVLGRDQSQSPADETKGVWLALGAGEARWGA